MADLLNWLNQIDTLLFLFFNAKLANPVFDFIMPIVTDKHTWYPIWLIALVMLSWKGGSKGRWAVLIALLAVGTTDLSVNRLLKPWFHRIRPCNVVEGAHLLLGKKSSYSLPSSHAANFFTLATVFSYFYRKYWVVFFFLAALVGYSRIAVGVHYPFDVLLGALVGMAIAWGWFELFKKLVKNKTKSPF